jgi:hypothetical protein
MRRIVVLLTVVALMAVVLAMAVAPAFAATWTCTNPATGSPEIVSVRSHHIFVKQGWTCVRNP